MRAAVHEPLSHWRVFGLIEEQRPKWDRSPGQQTVAWLFTLTEVGTTTALAQLHARATAPGRYPPR